MPKYVAYTVYATKVPRDIDPVAAEALLAKRFVTAADKLSAINQAFARRPELERCSVMVESAKSVLLVAA